MLFCSDVLSGILKHKRGPKGLDLPASQPGNGIHTFLIIAFSLRSQLREIVSNDTPIECVTEHLNWINLLQKENQFSKVHLFTYSAAAVHRCPLKSSSHNVTFFSFVYYIMLAYPGDYFQHFPTIFNSLDEWVILRWNILMFVLSLILHRQYFYYYSLEI